MAFINQRFLTQTEFDSAAPTGSATLALELTDPGNYVLAIAHKDKVLTQAPFVVRKQAEAAPAAAAGEARQAKQAAVSVDLAATLKPSGVRPEIPTMASAGWVSFSSSRPLPQHHVVLRRKDGKEMLDSRRLGSRSVFAVTLIRPGRYALTNTVDKKKAEIVVSYPEIGDTPYRPPEPLSIEVTDAGFGEPRFEVSPAQGIVFRFRTRSHITIKLVEPDDGPARERDR
jgi:hypothetical protein